MPGRPDLPAAPRGPPRLPEKGRRRTVAVFEWIAVVEDGDVADARSRAGRGFDLPDDVGVFVPPRRAVARPPHAPRRPLPRWAKPIRYSSSRWSWKGPRPPAATRPGSRAWCRERLPRRAHRAGRLSRSASRLAAEIGFGQDDFKRTAGQHRGHAGAALRPPLLQGEFARTARLLPAGTAHLARGTATAANR